MRRIVLSAVILFAALSASAISASSRYRSPRNSERKVRKSTELIVLHTTEAPEKSSLTKLCDRGEAHYCVTEAGQVYAIVDRDREAFHAGRSMWLGKEDCDKFSIGIECVGYHDKPMNVVQLRAIRDLVKDLQRMYRLADHQVVCHSHVAYGAPNRWHRFKHRGRKRCGMLFAMASVRSQLGLKTKPARDEDVRAGRLRNADDYLSKVLYGRTDTMVAAYSGVSRQPVPAETGIFKWVTGIMYGKGSSASAGPAAEKPTEPKIAPAKPVVVKASPSGKVPRTIAQLKAWGWIEKGTVSKSNSASKIAGGRWKSADTYYTIRNKVIPGSEINEARIEKGMTVWMKK